MNLYDTISQASLNDLIDDLLNNFHKELGLDLDDPVNDYCGLSFDTSDGLDAGSEVIFNNGDELRIGFSNQRLALLGYSLRFYYYLLDKGDLDGSKAYGELQSFVVDLDSELVCVPFTDDQVYLQKEFDLILLSNTGSRLSLSASTDIWMPGEDLVLSATFVSSGEPVPDKTVSFFDGETLMGTGITNSSGVATLSLSVLSGSHSFISVCDNVYSPNVVVDSVVSEYVMELTVTGDSFKTESSQPFSFNGKVYVDWGDDTGLIEYTGGYLQHNYTSSGEYSVKVYGNITSLQSSSFYECTGLTSISLPNSVTSIGGSCFRSCTSLNSIELPNNITNIGFSCFRSCTSLNSIELPNNITNIGNFCFYECTGLTSISLPNSVTSIGQSCFNDCTNLNSITLSWNTQNNIIPYNSTWIILTPSTLKFHIPQNTTQLYINNDYPSDKLVEDTV